MQMVVYHSPFFHCPAGTSLVKYEANKPYPITDETRHHVSIGAASMVEIEEGPVTAAEKVAHANRLAERANSLRDQADALKVQAEDAAAAVRGV